MSSPETGSQDPTGSYVRTWCPELSKLKGKLVHRPWEASAQELGAAGIVLGENYPHRIIVDLPSARQNTKTKVIEMRKQSMRYNDKMGYDLITLPRGNMVRVFTKEEYRLDSTGEIAVIQKRPRSDSGRGRGGKAERRKSSGRGKGNG